jgi:two-component system OmpR family response regulator
MAHVLVVDDDDHLREVVRFSLESAGHRVSEAQDGREAIRQFRSRGADLVVLDIVMPELDGLEVCRSLRGSSDVPVLFLSSRDEEVDRVLGLEMGGDDYVAKPFSPRELQARVKAMLRRSRPAEPPRDAERLSHGSLVLDAARHECHFGDREIPLTATEFQVLRTLLRAPERVFARSELVEQAYGYGHRITERTVDSHVRRIRRRFQAAGVDPIETVYGVGYRCLRLPRST